MSDSRYQVPYPEKEQLLDHHQMVLTGCLVITEGIYTLPVLPQIMEDGQPSGHHRNRHCMLYIPVDADGSLYLLPG